MLRVSEGRRKPRRATLREARGGWVTLENIPGLSPETPVKVLDASGGGLGIELFSEIPRGTGVIVRGEPGNPLSLGKARAGVVRWVLLPGGRYRAGLTYEDPSGDGARSRAV